MELFNNQLLYGDESKTNLIVNYLPESLTSNEFTSMFQSIGATKQCKLITDKKGGKNLGYGFVDYILESDAARSVQFFNGLKFENKVIKVSYARPSSDTIKESNLYVTGLPKIWTVHDFNRYFSICGKIITSRILFDKSTNSSKGVGFIRFDKNSEANIAIELLNGTIPSNSTHKICVRFAKYSSSKPTQNKKVEFDLLVVNLPAYVVEQNLLDIFSPFGHVSKVGLVRDFEPGVGVMGLVSMETYQDALNALNSLNGMLVDDRFVSVSFKTV